MRIISKHKDYYDYLSDPTDNLVLPRTQEFIQGNPNKQKININKYFKHIDEFSGHIYSMYNPRHIMYLFFCGRVYPIIVDYDPDSKLTPKEDKNYYFYDYINEFKDKKVKKWYWDRSHNKLTYTYIELSKESNDVLFEELNCVYFLYKWDGVILYPDLRRLNFHKTFDPQQTYQEIDMYLSSVLNKPNETIEISDNDKAQAKGFNDKSFKKPKNSKRGKPQWR